MGCSSTTAAAQITIVIAFPTLLAKNLPKSARLLCPAVPHFRGPRPEASHSGGKLPAGLTTLARRAPRGGGVLDPHRPRRVCHLILRLLTGLPPHPYATSPEAVASWCQSVSPSMYLADRGLLLASAHLPTGFGPAPRAHTGS
jgi:hypothetical protein